MFISMRLFVILPLFVGGMLAFGLRASEDKSAASIAASMKNRLVSSAVALAREKELKKIFDDQNFFPRDLQSIIFLYLKSSYYHARTMPGNVCCSLGNNKIAFGDLWSQSIGILNIESEAPAEALVYAGSTNCLLPLPDDQLASGSSGGVIRIWNLKTLAGIRLFQDSACPISSLVFNGNNLLISCAVGDKDENECCLWDFVQGTCLQKFEIGSMCSLSPEKLLMSDALERDKIAIWGTDDFLAMRKPQEVFQTKNVATIASMHVSPECRIAILDGRGARKKVETWNGKNKKHLYTSRFSDNVIDVAWLQGEVCAVLTENTGKGDVHLYDGETGESVGTLSIAVKDRGHSMTLTQVDDSLVVGSSSGLVGELTVLKRTLDIGGSESGT